MLARHTILGKAIRGEKDQDLPNKGEMKELQQSPQKKALSLSNSMSFIPPTRKRTTYIPVPSMKTMMLPSRIAQTKTQQGR